MGCCPVQDFCTGGIVGRACAPGGTGYTQRCNGCARMKITRAVEPRTGVYIIRASGVWRTGRTECTRVQAGFFVNEGYPALEST